MVEHRPRECRRCHAPLASAQVELRASYDRLVVAGLKAEPPPEVPELVRRQARNLLLRLERRKEEVLLFLTDFSVPFENNQAERERADGEVAAEDEWVLSQ